MATSVALAPTRCCAASFALWQAPLHELFTEDAGGIDTMHCAELVTETLKVLDLVSGSQQMDLLQTFYETTLVALQARRPP